MELPFLTADLPPIRLAYKSRWEDFVVEEVPAYDPEGAGDHTFVLIEKHGLATPRAVGDLAGALGVRPRDVGVAGMKDARSIARQWLSVEHVDPERVLALVIPRIRVLRAERHPRKLRRGHHAGNRFVLKLRDPRLRHDVGAGTRDADADAATVPAPGAGRIHECLADVQTVLDVLARRGVPNYYGSQRFGTRGDTWAVGRALARGDMEDAAALIAGRPTEHDTGDVRRARQLYDAGRYADAARAWPRGFRQCVAVCRAMDRHGDAARAVLDTGKRMLRLYASAYQSWLFNRVVARRIHGIDGLLHGDLAWKHDNEALFLVEDPAAEQPRAEAFEISPTGPLVGRRMRKPEGEAGALEREVLDEAGLDPAELDTPAMRPLGGSRRPLRFRLSEVRLEAGRDDLGPHLVLRFALPPGAYATEVLREIGKGELVEGSGAPPPPDDDRA